MRQIAFLKEFVSAFFLAMRYSQAQVQPELSLRESRSVRASVASMCCAAIPGEERCIAASCARRSVRSGITIEAGPRRTDGTRRTRARHRHVKCIYCGLCQEACLDAMSRVRTSVRDRDARRTLL